MKLNVKELNLTPEAVQELNKKYIIEVSLVDYFVTYYTRQKGALLFFGDLNKRFFRIFKNIIDTSAEDNEYWVKEHLGKDKDGWEHVEQRLYKGADCEHMNPGNLHLKIHLKIKKKNVRNLIGRYGIIEGTGKVLGQCIAALTTVFLLESFFPAKPGESTFMRNWLGSWAVLEGLDALDRSRELEQRVKNLEDRR